METKFIKQQKKLSEEVHLKNMKHNNIVFIAMIITSITMIISLIYFYNTSYELYPFAIMILNIILAGNMKEINRIWYQDWDKMIISKPIASLEYRKDTKRTFILWSWWWTEYNYYCYEIVEKSQYRMLKISYDVIIFETNKEKPKFIIEKTYDWNRDRWIMEKKTIVCPVWTIIKDFKL